MNDERVSNKTLVDELFSYDFSNAGISNIRRSMREKMVPRIADGDIELIRSVRSRNNWQKYMSWGIGHIGWSNYNTLDRDIYAMSVWALGTLHLMAGQSRFARPRAKDIGVVGHYPNRSLTTAGIAASGALAHRAESDNDAGLACAVLCLIDEMDIRHDIIPYIGGEQRIRRLHDIVAMEVDRYRAQK